MNAKAAAAGSHGPLFEAGWKLIAEVKGRQWDTPSRRRQIKRPAEDKLLWEFAHG